MKQEGNDSKQDAQEFLWSIFFPEEDKMPIKNFDVNRKIYLIRKNMLFTFFSVFLPLTILSFFLIGIAGFFTSVYHVLPPLVMNLVLCWFFTHIILLLPSINSYLCAAALVAVQFSLVRISDLQLEINSLDLKFFILWAATHSLFLGASHKLSMLWLTKKLKKQAMRKNESGQRE